MNYLYVRLLTESSVRYGRTCVYGDIEIRSHAIQLIQENDSLLTSINAFKLSNDKLKNHRICTMVEGHSVHQASRKAECSMLETLDVLDAEHMGFASYDLLPAGYLFNLTNGKINSLYFSPNTTSHTKLRST